MAWPAPYGNATATYDKLANTFKRDVDAKLWAALQAKSPILDMLDRPKVGNPKFEWETDVAPVRTYTSQNDGGNDTMTSSANDADNVLSFTSVEGLEVGSLMRNITRATTIGSYGQDEILEVRSIAAYSAPGYLVTFTRDAAAQASANANSTAHANGDVYETIYTPKEEGSSPNVNKYKDVVLVENYANTVDFYLTVTGDQAATGREVAGDTLENQFNKNLVKLNNDLERMFFYGCLSATPAGDAATYIRRTKGFDSWVGASGGNYDVTTTAVTAAALDALFYSILEDATDPSDPFIIACHPLQARKISALGIDKVRYGQEETKYGRHIDTFKSDLGVEAKIIWSLNISKGDLFIIDTAKVSMPMFRPFEVAEWSYGDDGVDAWRKRYLGSFGVKVVDGLKSHAKLGLLART